MTKLFFYALFFCGALVTVSCDDDDDMKKDPANNGGGGAASSELAGDISKTTTLDKASYKLAKPLVVKAGATLNIEAGVVITSVESSGTNVPYIAVERGAKINIKGTKEKPVVMTCDVKEPGSWGGLVICGYAPTNKGKDVTSEVAELKYGGDKADDNSGSIKYLRLEYTGKAFNEEKQFNGVSLFGVGSGTTFEYVSSLWSNDDGIEFFGGTVNGKYLVSVKAGDDGIDFADGWNGKGHNWHVVDAAKSSIEGSNNGKSRNATPVTTVELKNITLHGSKEKPFYFKEGGFEGTITNVAIGGLDGKDHQYFYFDESSADPKKNDTDAKERVKKVTITDIRFIGEVADDKKKKAEFTITEKADATGSGSITKDLPTWAAGWAMAASK